MNTKITLLTMSDTMDAIQVLSTDAKSVQDRIHAIACSTLDHIRAHGDTTTAIALLNALPNGQRVKALAFWFSKFSAKKAIFTLDKKAKTWKCALSKQRDDSDFDVAAAMETSFADLTDEKDPKTVTIEAILKMLERNANNSDTHESTGEPKVDPAARAFAASLVAFARTQKADATVN